MSQLVNLIKSLFALLFSNKSRIFLALTSTLVFLFLLFPFSDLGDLVSGQVSKATGNRVYVQFENMSISLIPGLGISVSDALMDTPDFPTLQAKNLKVTPSMLSAINNKPAGSISAEGFMGGSLDLSLGSGSKTENGIERQKIRLSAEALSLNELRQLLQLPVALKGKLNLESSALIDFGFQAQPDLDVTLTIEKFELPPSSVQTLMGPMTLPELQLTNLELKGRLSDGQFRIESGRLGKQGDELTGTIKGSIGLQLQNRGNMITPIIGSYNFEVDLNVKKSFQDRANLFLSFVDQFKSATAEGARYSFKLNAPNPTLPPSFGALR